MVSFTVIIISILNTWPILVGGIDGCKPSLFHLDCEPLLDINGVPTPSLHHTPGIGENDAPEDGN
jgi:hypothetical protein